ncbi:MAG: peptidoglycan DD-metalloendopeptidase family protein [Deltaproteobacteria bacterium]|nr:peptidoglycan DD-metalloendopeptidase family protein [Deltaproteobacteria bacterium]
MPHGSRCEIPPRRWPLQPPQGVEQTGCRISLLIIFLLLSSCATSYNARGQFHQVRRGETFWTIARFYRANPQQLAEYNDIENPQEVVVGTKLYIPPKPKNKGWKRLPMERAIERASSDHRARRKGGEVHAARGKKIESDHGRFTWPVSGRVLSGFGFRNGRRHDGIDIKAGRGTPIHAAGNGVVAFSGRMNGYGNVILVRHKDDFFTAYAHNSVNKVKEGQEVKAGQVIALVGTTGRTTGPHLHFEVRHGQTARNPLFFLPKRDGEK